MGDVLADMSESSFDLVSSTLLKGLVAPQRGLLTALFAVTIFEAPTEEISEILLRSSMAWIRSLTDTDGSSSSPRSMASLLAMIDGLN